MNAKTVKKQAKPPEQPGAGGDWIHLRQIEVKCLLGVHPSERIHIRPVRLDLSLECDVRPAAKSDQLEDALNYEVLEAQVVGAVKKTRYRLVEALAEHVAEICLKQALVKSVRVMVEKPGALPLTRSVAVEITRRKPADA
jgi:D-erythro-7,8-dihydroneopterin triphosphate epimerase